MPTPDENQSMSRKKRFPQSTKIKCFSSGKIKECFFNWRSGALPTRLLCHAWGILKEYYSLIKRFSAVIWREKKDSKSSLPCLSYSKSTILWSKDSHLKKKKVV